MHILPDLKKIEKLYSVTDGLVVVGVHSAKFDNEKDSSNILSAVQRYDITHPVINDINCEMWTALNIQCWPTLLILGPRGNPLFVIMGEGHYETLEMYINAAMKFYKSDIKDHQLPLNPATELIISANLKFPGKITCSKINNEDVAELYAVSDSGNNRVLILNANGEVMQKIGGKAAGLVDGNFNDARFNNPQGLGFLSNDVLFVADTDNHAIRKINLKLKIVETVVGNGRQGNDRVGGKKMGKEQEISSPWDVAIYKTPDMDMSFHMDKSSIPEKDIVLIAMAGTHQIWALFLEDVIWWKFTKYVAGTCVAIAGNGLEENRNNSYPNNASFAQPSGLALSKDSKELFIADSESSSIRKLSLADGKVSAVGGGEINPKNLFAYGDQDGRMYSAKFQHPIGVAFNKTENTIYVADTYNHKIKKIDAKTLNVETCNIVDQSNNNNDHQFNEPGGLCLNPTGDMLYIADTNNHSIEIIDLYQMKKKSMTIIFDSKPKTLELGDTIELQPLKIKKTGGKLHFSVSIEMDEEIHITEAAPQKWNVYLPNENWYINQQNGLYRIGTNIELDISAPKFGDNEEDVVIVSFKLNLCKTPVCFPKVFSIKIPTIYDDDGLDCIIEDISIKVYEKHIVKC